MDHALVGNVTNIRSDRTNESIFFKRMKGEIILFYQQIMYHIEKHLIGVQNVYISIKETVMKFKNHFNLLNLQRNKRNNNNNVIQVKVVLVIINFMIISKITLLMSDESSLPLRYNMYSILTERTS